MGLPRSARVWIGWPFCSRRLRGRTGRRLRITLVLVGVRTLRLQPSAQHKGTMRRRLAGPLAVPHMRRMWMLRTCQAMLRCVE